MASSSSVTSAYPTLGGIELRRAVDGAWLPFDVQDGHFVGHFCISGGESDAAIEVGNAPLEFS